MDQAPQEKWCAVLQVLVIEHNPFLLQVITRFLHETFPDQFSVTGILRGDEKALEKFRKFAQVILLDVDTCGGEFPEMIRHVRQSFVDGRIVAMASLAAGCMPSARQAALAAGADDFISKRDLGTDLHALLCAVSGGRQI